MLFRSVAVALVLGSSLRLGQPLVGMPPGAPQAAGGPSLADTMKYIEGKLNSIAAVAYTAYPADGSESFVMGGGQYRYHYTTDASACTVTGEMQVDATKITQVIPLHNVSKIEAGTVTSFSQSPGWRFVPDLPELRLSSGTLSIETTSSHPDTSVKKDKHHTEVPMVSTKTTGKVWAVVFDDADAADRTAKAFLHAVELCGGGNSKELF